MNTFTDTLTAEQEALDAIATAKAEVADAVREAEAEKKSTIEDEIKRLQEHKEEALKQHDSEIKATVDKIQLDADAQVSEVTQQFQNQAPGLKTKLMQFLD
jgi:vacuolar-type H+-ATPase subunit H